MPALSARIRARLPPAEQLLPPLALGVLYAVAVAWMLGPMWSDLTTHVVGDADTDAVRGLWGLDHLRRSLLPPDTPLWSSEINFPSGVLALVLPWVSGLMTAPLGAVVGPVAGFNLTVAFLLWAAAWSTAVLGWARTDSWVAGGMFGAAVPSTPMILHAVADGTPEHVAIWLVPLFLAAATRLLRTPSVGLGLLAGGLAVLVVLDSPYHGVYTLILGLLVLPWDLLGPWPKRRRLPAPRSFAVAIAVVAIGAIGVGLLFRSFPIEAPGAGEGLRLLKMNATDLHTWWQHDFTSNRPRDGSLAPTAITAVFLWPALVFAAIGVPRSLPWLVAGLGMVMLSLGLNDRIVAELAVWMGERGSALGQWILRTNRDLYDLPGIGSVRFPRRWLLPATLAFAVAGAEGLGRLVRLAARWRWARKTVAFGGPVLVVVATFAVVHAGADTAAISRNFPKHALPDVAFANWIAEHDRPGAVVLLPQRRPAPKSGKRADLPVFADISENLSSSDSQYLQVRMGRPLLSYPSLKTLAPMRVDTDIQSILRNWDDIALPELSGRDIPSSAIDPRFAPQRQRIIDGLRQDGLAFVVVDDAAYGASGLAHLQSQLQDHLAETQHFDDGTGVTVFVLR